MSVMAPPQPVTIPNEALACTLLPHRAESVLVSGGGAQLRALPPSRTSRRRRGRGGSALPGPRRPHPNPLPVTAAATRPQEAGGGLACHTPTCGGRVTARRRTPPHAHTATERGRQVGARGLPPRRCCTRAPLCARPPLRWRPRRRAGGGGVVCLCVSVGGRTTHVCVCVCVGGAPQQGGEGGRRSCSGSFFGCSSSSRRRSFGGDFLGAECRAKQTGALNGESNV